MGDHAPSHTHVRGLNVARDVHAESTRQVEHMHVGPERRKQSLQDP